MSRTCFWQDLRTTDFEPGAFDDAVALLPVAAVEQHGPHLPLGTDAFIAEGFVDRVVERLGDDIPALFLPVLQIGASREHGNFAGTLSAGWDDFARLIIDIGEGVARAGIRKLIIVTAHGGNVAAMDSAALELRARHGMVVVATSWYRFGMPEGVFPEAELSYGIHGGMVETSIMMHLRPDLVRRDRLADFPSRQRDFEKRFRRLRVHGRVQFGWLAEDLNPAGVVGDAGGADAEKGRAALEFGADAFIELLADMAHLDTDTV
ncbi:MAG: creatininase family protein [Hyphomicrobiales bacterium]|nr:creatininase family protein [Hyphomicrobiales bacterium]